jgi:hypothetical protein
MVARTLEQIESMPTEVLTCADVAHILGANADTIRQQARERPELLGFRTIIAGNRVKIPKRAFVRFMRGEDAKE